MTAWGLSALRHRVVRRVRARRLLPAAWLALAASLPQGLGAQDAGSAVTFAGQVIDTWQGDPVEGAVVSLMETIRPDGTRIVGVTDAEGRFSMDGVPPGPSRVSVTRLGYADLFQVLDIRSGQFIEVVLIPKPVILEGIEVYVDRLETRLRELPYVTSTFMESQLRLAPDQSVADYLDSQAGFEFVPCFEDFSGTGLFRQRRDCIRTRGAMVQRPSIYIDDAPAFGGIGELAAIPTMEIYRIEVIRGCGQIRVYTSNYVEGTVITARPLLPIIC